jgi:predicted dehydrogenase
VNYCRRPLAKFQKVKELIAAGSIGETVIFLASLDGWDQMEWGAHWHDIFQLWANDQPVRWMMGQARCDGSRTGYGHLIEQHSLSYYSFEDGTRALLEGGEVHRGKQALRVVGTTGMIEVGWDAQITLTNGEGRHVVPCEGSIHPQGYGNEISLQIPHSLLDWMEGGPEPELGLTNAIRSTEVYLACYESAKIGDRVDIPLGPQGSFPLDDVAARHRKSDAADTELKR